MSFVRQKLASCRSLLFAGTVLACSTFVVMPVQAGFEWTPPTQNPAQVPVVTPKRQVVIPSPAEDVQKVPVAMPPRLPALSAEATGKDPNTRVHTMRRMEEASKRVEESKQSILRVIEKNPDYKKPAPVVQPVRTQPVFKQPVARPVEPTTVGMLPPLPAMTPPPAQVSSKPSAVEPSFTPMPYASAPVQVQRKTNASSHVNIVQEAMLDVQQNYKAQRSSLFVPHDRIAVPEIPDPVPVSAVTPAPMPVEAPAPTRSSSIVINPYPKKGGAAAIGRDRQPQARVTPVVTRSAPPARHYEMASGFGSDIPLIMALQQIVPAQYTYSFDPSVNPGQRVSWEGGQGWDRVVLDMLKPVGLTARVHGNSMVIKQAF